MQRDQAISYSNIGTWSEAKLELIRKYGTAYSTILSKRPRLTHVYIDAFAGAGMHVSRKTGELVQGSPIQALEIDPPFAEYHFIDTDGEKVEALRLAAGARTGVHIYQGDANVLLLDRVFPQVQYEGFQRALCLLDPYGLHLDWRVLETAGRMRSVEIFLNFPMLDINRNALLNDTSKADPAQVARLTRFWGDESWRDVVYESYGSEFFQLEIKRRTSRSALVDAFQKRLKEITKLSRER
jgi:three-Cys-motif partner protein